MKASEPVWGHLDEPVRKAVAKAKSTGRPVITAEQQSFTVKLTGRKNFWMLIDNAFKVLFEGEVRLNFKRSVK